MLGGCGSAEFVNGASVKLEPVACVSSGQRRNPVANGTVRRLLWPAVAAAVVLAAGCAGGDVFEDALSLADSESAVEFVSGDVDVGASGAGLHDLNRQELRDGPAVQRLGVARLLGDLGVMEMLDSYIVNIPTGAYFLHNFEIHAAMSASRIMGDRADDEARIVRDFEQTVLIALDGDALNRRPAPTGADRLHDAFFEVFEQCGRDSPWPEVKMADREGNAAGDVLYLDPALGISMYEYRELLHVCGRYAATYPTLDPEVRDELLASQRAYFAQGVLDRLDNELPVVEIPARYQAEVDDLRANGW